MSEIEVCRVCGNKLDSPEYGNKVYHFEHRDKHLFPDKVHVECYWKEKYESLQEEVIDLEERAQRSIGELILEQDKAILEALSKR